MLRCDYLAPTHMPENHYILCRDSDVDVCVNRESRFLVIIAPSGKARREMEPSAVTPTVTFIDPPKWSEAVGPRSVLRNSHGEGPSFPVFFSDPRAP